MSWSRGPDDRPVLRLMNEYWCEVPLWDHDGLVDDTVMGLSEELLRDLMAFNERWEDARGDVGDDSLDGHPELLRQRDEERRRYRERHPEIAEAEQREQQAIEEQGRALRERVQAEVGDRYRVVYLP